MELTTFETLSLYGMFALLVVAAGFQIAANHLQRKMWVEMLMNPTPITSAFMEGIRRREAKRLGQQQPKP